MDLGKLTARVKGMVLEPRTEWPQAAAEATSVRHLYLGYIAIVAAVPLVFQFIKGSLIGYSAFGVTVRTPVGAGLAGLLIGYALSLALVYVMALVIDALAPHFNGRRDRTQALKTAAYAWTASWVAGVAVIIPWLGWLIMLAGAIYAIYLMYLGLPHTMQCPPDRAAGYTAVSVVVAVVLSWVVLLAVGGITSAGWMAGGARISQAGGGSVSYDKDSTLGALAAAGARMQAVGSGATHVEALAPDRLKAFLPESLGNLQRTSLSASRNAAMGMQISEAQADYANGDDHVSITITDTGGASGLLSMAGILGVESERQSATGYDKTWREDGRMIHEQWDQRSRRGEYSLIVGDRFTVEATGRVGAVDQLKQALAGIDLAQLESLKEAGVVASD